MSQTVELAQFHSWLQQYAERIEEQENYLSELDAVIGDADHGANMQRGMMQVRRQLERANGGNNSGNNGGNTETVSTFLRSTAMTLISSVGGAAGPLYGAFFLRAAKDAGNSDSVELAQLARMFRDGLEGIKQRGKAEVEEKTMIDVLEPAIIALEETAATGGSLDAALDAACFAAKAGMLHTIDLEAQKGRASYLGPRSVGHQDPGATSSFYLIETAAGTLGSEGHEAPADLIGSENG